MQKYIVLALVLLTANSIRYVQDWNNFDLDLTNDFSYSSRPGYYGPQMKSYPAYWNWDNWHNNNWYIQTGNQFQWNPLWDLNGSVRLDSNLNLNNWNYGSNNLLVGGSR
jgi:hypothetical protein